MGSSPGFRHSIPFYYSMFELTQETEEVRDLWQVRVGDGTEFEMSKCRGNQSVQPSSYHRDITSNTNRTR
jgi:hypothetical protein